MLRTSINMSHIVFVNIALAAAKLKTSRQAVVIMLLKRVLRDIDRFQGGFTLVKYQPRDPLKRWHCFPICFRKNENEFASDFRKLSRFSVAHLVAIATKRYLHELLHDSAGRHNYVRFPHYAIGQRSTGGILCWEFYWGDTENHPERASPTKILRRTASH
ncbi:MAG: hypothetical protein EPN93_09645 [Spirochaetes bacterium]|nr:MAG: hypothetical protein EPN93_09645 [Spirochaetota bacterium]